MSDVLYSVSVIKQERDNGNKRVGSAVRLRTVSTVDRVRFLASPCKICGGQSDTTTGLSPTNSVSPCHYNSTNAPHSSTCCCYQKDKRAKRRKLQTKQCCFRSRGAGDRRGDLIFYIISYQILLFAIAKFPV